MLNIRMATCGMALLTACGVQSLAQTAPRPIPPKPVSPAPVPPAFHIVPPRSPNVVVVTSTPPAQPAQASIPTAYRPMPPDILAWDSETQQTTIPFGKPQAYLAFALTNVSQTNVVVNSVNTSCGCTVPELPPLPWTLTPGDSGQIKVTMNVAGKSGVVVKSVTVQTDQGFKTVYVRTTIEAPPAGEMGQMERMRNLQIAMRNRQAVFQGDCATCHSRTKDEAGNLLHGQELYTSVCGVCHEAEHRASMVPDLHNLQKETPADYWRTWITSSADGKMMPAFAQENGGILSKEQIDSLVNYLVGAIPSYSAAQPGPTRRQTEPHSSASVQPVLDVNQLIMPPPPSR